MSNNGEIKPFGVPLYKDGPINRFRNKKNLASIESKSIEDMAYVYECISSLYNPKGGPSHIETDAQWKYTEYVFKIKNATNIYVLHKEYTEIPERLYTFLMELVVKNRNYLHRPFVTFDMLENIIEHILTHYKQNHFDAIRNLMNDKATLEYIENSSMENYADFSDSYTKEPVNKQLIIWFKSFFLNTFLWAQRDAALLIYKKELKEGRSNYEFIPLDFYFESKLKEYCSNTNYKYTGAWFTTNSRLYESAVDFALSIRKTYPDTISMGYDTFILLTDDTVTFRGKTLYRIKYLKDISYVVDDVLHSVKAEELGGYVSDLSFIHENVIIKSGAKIMPYSLISAGVIIEKDVVVNCNVVIFKHCFLINKSNVSTFTRARLSINEENLIILRRKHVALPFIYPKPKPVVVIPPEQLALF